MWPWIDRNVEPTIEKWLKIPASIVLVRGHRRCGKSSAIRRVSQKLKLNVIELTVVSEHADLLRNAKFSFMSDIEINGIFEIAKYIESSVKNGFIVIVKEIQNSSCSFQVVLQQSCDKIAFNSMHCKDEWKSAGGLVEETIGGYTQVNFN